MEFFTSARFPKRACESCRLHLLGTGSLSIMDFDTVTHRYWQYLNQQDIFFPISLWPLWAQKLILLPHKSDSQMFNLFFFLNANGLLPGFCKAWIVAFDYNWADKKLIDGVYTQKEVEDINKVMVKAYQGKLLEGNKRVYDMILKRPVVM